MQYDASNGVKSDSREIVQPGKIYMHADADADAAPSFVSVSLSGRPGRVDRSGPKSRS